MHGTSLPARPKPKVGLDHPTIWNAHIVVIPNPNPSTVNVVGHLETCLKEVTRDIKVSNMLYKTTKYIKM